MCWEKNLLGCHGVQFITSYHLSLFEKKKDDLKRCITFALDFVAIVMFF